MFSRACGRKRHGLPGPMADRSSANTSRHRFDINRLFYDDRRLALTFAPICQPPFGAYYGRVWPHTAGAKDKAA